MARGLTTEAVFELVMGGLYMVTSVAALQRLTTYRCAALPRPNRVFHLVLFAFAAVRAVDMLVTAFSPGDSKVDVESIFLSRLAICLFFSLCSHVVAQW